MPWEMIPVRVTSPKVREWLETRGSGPMAVREAECRVCGKEGLASALVCLRFGKPVLVLDVPCEHILKEMSPQPKAEVFFVRVRGSEETLLPEKTARWMGYSIPPRRRFGGA